MQDDTYGQLMFKLIAYGKNASAKKHKNFQLSFPSVQP